MSDPWVDEYGPALARMADDIAAIRSLLQRQEDRAASQARIEFSNQRRAMLERLATPHRDRHAA